MAAITPVSELMTTRVTTLSVGAAPSEARHLLARRDIHHLPVVDSGRLVGVLSTRDLVRALRAAGAARGDEIDAILDRGAAVGDLMSRDLVTLPPHASVEAAVDLIADGSIHSVLIVDDDQQLVGIATDTDLLDYFCS